MTWVSTWWRSRRSPPPLVQDIVLAAVLCAIWWTWLLTHAESGQRLAVELVLSAAGTWPLAVRHKWPLPAWAAVLGVAVVVAWGGYPTALGDIPALLAVYSAGNFLSGRAQVVSGVLSVVWSQAVPAILGQTTSVTPYLSGLLLFGTAWLLGAQHQRTRQLTEALRREQEKNAQRAVIAERSRIARDLHDAVAHHISAISVHAYAASEALEVNPATARTSLRHVGAASKAVISEARWIVGLLDSDDGEQRTQPSLRNVARLVEPVRAAGNEVTVTIAPAALEVAESVQTAAYRILQEALTNVVNHAGPTTVRAEVERFPHALRVEVVNGRSAAKKTSNPRSGRGLVGMRERVALFGGSLEAGPVDGGYRVEAVLVVEEP
ncbi:histidine kinase [Amycolatopsis oliviviridis]|uniref:sensor histidine kinase n=1 Tax=Amycolatopsis oliviviridis TaxID=1471590 RepID=UPI00174B4A93|nr:histidine kinase [Amycolatopsis oliviviridis]